MIYEIINNQTNSYIKLQVKRNSLQKNDNWIKNIIFLKLLLLFFLSCQLIALLN